MTPYYLSNTMNEIRVLFLLLPSSTTGAAGGSAASSGGASTTGSAADGSGSKVAQLHNAGSRDLVMIFVVTMNKSLAP